MLERQDKAGGRDRPESAKRMQDAALLESIAQARAGNAEAWGEVYQHYAAAIFRFCRRVLPTREDAEDATMDIFLKIKGKLHQYDPSHPFGAWLYKVASNHCWDLLRRRHIRQDLETGDVETIPLEHPDPGQLDQLLTAQSGKRVRDALHQLPARARMVLVLRYYADLNYDEIADALGLRRAFVGVVLLRARHQLRELLRERPPGEAAISRAGGAS
jgi:RNA polymerase sigma-70 factor (ECF subfamily)